MGLLHAAFSSACVRSVPLGGGVGVGVGVDVGVGVGVVVVGVVVVVVGVVGLVVVVVVLLSAQLITKSVPLVEAENDEQVKISAEVGSAEAIPSMPKHAAVNVAILDFFTLNPHNFNITDLRHQ